MLPIEEPRIRAILLDIEGTTTPADFVYKVLFPYASRKLEDYLRAHSHEAEIRALIDALKAQQDADRKQGLDPPALSADSEDAEIRALAAYGCWLIARDTKCTPLKTLQGRIWRQGYESQELRGEIYPDVPPAFARWRRQGRDVCIYSSGSVLAQQLLFRTTPAGDLTRFLRAYFDTQAGAKTSAESYRGIASSLGLAEHNILFISDEIKELDAARSAGMHTALCARPPQQNLSHPGGHRVIQSFEGVFP